MILQLKTGRLDVGYFRDKFGVDILDDWRDAWQQFHDEGLLDFDGDRKSRSPRGPAAGRRLVAGVLRAGAPGRAVYVSRFLFRRGEHFGIAVSTNGRRKAAQLSGPTGLSTRHVKTI